MTPHSSLPIVPLSQQKSTHSVVLQLNRFLHNVNGNFERHIHIEIVEDRLMLVAQPNVRVHLCFLMSNPGLS